MPTSCVRARGLGDSPANSLHAGAEHLNQTPARALPTARTARQPHLMMVQRSASRLASLGTSR
jgi:hypothetical protein